jgi:hypothetical protein
VQYTSSIDAAKLGQFVHKVTSNSLKVFPSSFACLSFPSSVLFSLLSLFWSYWGDFRKKPHAMGLAHG